MDYEKFKAVMAAAIAPAWNGKLGCYGIGDAVVIRTVTQYQLGRIAAIDEKFVTLSTPCGWVAHTGRWHEFLESGKVREFEPQPGPVVVSLAAIVDVNAWTHPIPTEPV